MREESSLSLLKDLNDAVQRLFCCCAWLEQLAVQMQPAVLASRFELKLERVVLGQATDGETDRPPNF